ncbi:hypothetical protein J2800_000699 [Caulobacter rhizosphaerae]|uniref:Uncharacterized protein n=1 Tax=Caulobacter rhizosphaerae TaxID=2010972 RepID=A0ABU1MUW3_9CAUL|nr:hypothetical protein [Caulobacter rhizosphaerae]MDR6529975.1 hypothetical protein [Caulobacter rhizosphaerae]
MKAAHPGDPDPKAVRMLGKFDARGDAPRQGLDFPAPVEVFSGVSHVDGDPHPGLRRDEWIVGMLS